MENRASDGVGRSPVTFGIVTALEKEYAAVLSMLDDRSDEATPRGHVYCEGTVPAKGGGTHRVAVALARPGTVPAAVAATPTQAEVHKELIKRLLQRPFDIWEYRYVARALRSHPRGALQDLIKGYLVTSHERELWLVREIEKASGELLVDETGNWLS